MRSLFAVGLLLALIGGVCMAHETSMIRNSLIAEGKMKYTQEDLLDIFEDYGYPRDTEHFRFKIFERRLEEYIAHNLNADNTWTKGISKFTFWTDEERVGVMAPQNCSATAEQTLQNPTKIANLPNAPLPHEWDWRKKGVVSKVKNQGKCGSCWTFSTTGSLEAHWALKHGVIPDLSEQQLVDCAGAFNNFGCKGGLPSQAFEYIKYNGGLNAEVDYPYEAHDGTCRYKRDHVAVTVPRGSFNITAYDEEELTRMVAFVGPVSIAFQVYGDFHDYKTGVYTSKGCKNGPTDINHAVLAVGYGVSQTGMPYWIVKNSWGETWGQGGYFLIERNKNMCGLAVCNSFPLINEKLEVVQVKQEEVVM